jgi:hypothetical protein
LNFSNLIGCAISKTNDEAKTILEKLNSDRQQRAKPKANRLNIIILML